MCLIKKFLRLKVFQLESSLEVLLLSKSCRQAGRQALKHSGYVSKSILNTSTPGANATNKIYCNVAKQNNAHHRLVENYHLTWNRVHYFSIG